MWPTWSRFCKKQAELQTQNEQEVRQNFNFSSSIPTLPSPIHHFWSTNWIKILDGMLVTSVSSTDLRLLMNVQDDTVRIQKGKLKTWAGSNKMKCEKKTNTWIQKANRTFSNDWFLYNLSWEAGGPGGWHQKMLFWCFGMWMAFNALHKNHYAQRWPLNTHS